MSDETDNTSEIGDAIRELAHVVRTEDEIALATAWSDFRKEYGVSANDATRAKEYRSFKAGWEAAKGTLDIGGVQR